MEKSKVNCDKILFFKKENGRIFFNWLLVCGANKREHIGDINEF